MIKYIFTLIFIFFLLNNNFFAQVQNNQITTGVIIWPNNYDPAKSKFFVHNEIEISASPSTVWQLLIDALQWESWYKGAEKVSINDSRDTTLLANSIFTWKTMGMNFQSVIREYTPNNLLAWESKKKCVQSYTIWLIVPNQNGCKVILDETQNGWLTSLEKVFLPNKLKKLHDSWLSELKIKSEKNLYSKQ